MIKIKLLFWVVLCLPFASFAQYNSSIHGIQWRNDLSWDDIKEMARQTSKNIFIDCYATWCGPCKMMDKDVYTNDNLVEYFNGNFISIRLQMDSTSKDDETVKKWFSLAEQLNSKYVISSLPTLMFFSPDEILLDKLIGYQDVRSLLITGKAIPSKIHLYNQLDAYKNGKKDYAIMYELADFAKKIMANKKLSNQIAKEYKEGYLEKLSIDSLLNQKYVQFVLSYPELIDCRDNLFQVFYQYPEKVDSLLGKQTALRFINWLVTHELLTNKLVKDKKPVQKGDPDWRRLENDISNRYPKLDASTLVNNFRIVYYRKYDLNWSKWAYYKNIRIKQTPPNYKDWIAISSELNDGGAWDVFVNCNEKPILRIALDWINLAIQLDGKSKPGISNEAYLDTKANVLYKLGKVKDAIKVEQEAIDAVLKTGTTIATKQAKIYELVVEQMRAGKPTYTQNGAVWDERTLPVN